MKITKLSFVAIMACAASFAASDVASAFKEGKLDGRIRMHYIDTDWDKNQDWDKTTSGAFTGNKSDRDSRGLAIGGSLVYKTAPLYGVSGGVGFYTTQNIAALTDTGANSSGSRTTSGSYKNTTASDFFARGPGAATDFSKGYSVLAQAYLQYDISKSSIKAGRFLMTNPFINPNDTKMIPLAIEGASAQVKEFGDTVVYLDYATKIKERGMDSFHNMADTGDVPDAIKNKYHTTYTATAVNNASGTGTSITAADIAGYGTGNNAPAVAVVGLKNTSIKNLELQAWGMNWPDIVQQGLLEANYAVKAGDVGISFGGRYMQQLDKGAGNVIKPGSGNSLYSYEGVTNSGPTGSDARQVAKKGDSDDSINTYMYAVRAVAKYSDAKLLLAYSHTDKGGDLLASWRGFPTDGYTRSMTQTDWNANTKAYKAQIDYDFSSIIKGVSALLSYSFYDRDPSKVPYQGMTNRYYGNGDTRQINFDVKYAVPYVKGMEWKVRTMIQKNDVVSMSQLPGYVAGSTKTWGTASEGIGNDTSNRELRIEMNYLF